MRYAIWNNKGGVGKTFLSFMVSTAYAIAHPDKHVILVDMCPQANISEIVLGGNGEGSKHLESLLKSRSRKTVGGYFDTRISSPHSLTGQESEYILQIKTYNKNLPDNLWLIPGDPSLELQSQVINQISSIDLPEDGWKNVHCWLRDLIIACSRKLGVEDVIVFIDCNPSFSSYTELAMLAAEGLIVPCSSDGSSARAIDNIGALLYGLNTSKEYQKVSFSSRARSFGLGLPMIHSIVLNRSTMYRKEPSKAHKAMFDAIKNRVLQLKQTSPGFFKGGELLFKEMPDSHSVAIVCSHYGFPLNQLKQGPYQVHDETTQVNKDPLTDYQDALKNLIETIQ